MKDSKIRYIAYALIAICALVEFILGVITAATSTNSVPLYIALVLAILTLFAVAILAIFNNRPKSDIFLAKLNTHAIVLAITAQAWFPMTVMLTADASVACRWPNSWHPMPCRLPIPGTIFAYLLTAIATSSCLFIFYRGQEHGFNINVSEVDAVGPIHLSDERRRPSITEQTTQIPSQQG